MIAINLELKKIYHRSRQNIFPEITCPENCQSANSDLNFSRDPLFLGCENATKLHGNFA